MELKFPYLVEIHNDYWRSNRTFMELKWRKGARILLENLVLIVPLWN